MATKKSTVKPAGKQGGKVKTKEQGKQTVVVNKPAITAKIDRIFDKPDSNLRAIASVSIGNEFAVHGFRVLESQNGLFVSMPCTSYKDGEGKTQYSDTFHPITKESREELLNEIKSAYEQALEKKQTEGQEEEASETESEGEIPFEGPAL